MFVAGAVLAQANSDTCPTTILGDELQSRFLKSTPNSTFIRGSNAEDAFLHFCSTHGRDTDMGGVCNLLSGPPEDGAGGAKLLACDFQVIT